MTYSLVNGSTSSANASRIKRVNISKSLPRRKHLKGKVRESSKRYVLRKRMSQEVSDAILLAVADFVKILRNFRDFFSTKWFRCSDGLSFHDPTLVQGRMSSTR